MEFLHRTWAEIDLDALENNFRAIQKCCQKSVYAVVKADAYGHGAIEIATRLEKLTDGFAVSNIEEALVLRKAGIQKPVLILGYTPPECAEILCCNSFTQCVYDLGYAQALNAQAKNPVSVHLKLDTGMGRIGFDCRSDDLPGIDEAKQVLTMGNLRAEGVFAHFAVADVPAQQDFTQQQYARFVAAVEALEATGHRFLVKHCGNSAALLTLPMEETQVVRAGIVLYGLSPSEEVAIPKEIQPVMSLHSVVSMVKTVEAGQSVSYGRTYVTPGARRIATVSAGYADGVPRELSNQGSVLLRGKRAPIVGRICMDQFCVDVTHIPDAQMGDTVTIFGKEISVEEVAKNAKTIAYDVVCGISKRVTRVYSHKD